MLPSEVLIVTDRLIETAGIAEDVEKPDESPDTLASVGVEIVCNVQKALVIFGRFLIAFAPGGGLGACKKVIRLVGSDIKSFQKKAKTFFNIVLVKFEQPDAGPREMLLSVQSDRIGKKAASLGKAAGGKPGRVVQTGDGIQRVELPATNEEGLKLRAPLGGK